MIKKLNYSILIVFIILYILIVYSGSLYQSIYLLMFEEVDKIHPDQGYTKD